MKHYKIIMLIIDDDSLKVYADLRNAIKKYCHTDSEILTFFLRNSNEIENDFLLDNDTLYFKGNESLFPGIFNKTIKAFKYCVENYDFDFIVRTNLSSFWNFKLLKRKCDSLSMTNTVCAIIGNTGKTCFPSGAGFILSKDIVEFCITNLNDFQYHNELNDDVCFGLFFVKHNIKMQMGRRYDLTAYKNCINDDDLKKIANLDIYHYRIKSECPDFRIHDVEIFEKMYKFIYGI